MMHPGFILLLGWGIMAVVMALLWRWCEKQRNAGYVDVMWAGGIAGLALLFAALSPGEESRRVLVGLLGAAWALRLAMHLFGRVSGEAEDGRYRSIRESKGQAASSFFFWFFQIQAFWAVLFAAPMLAAMLRTGPLDVLDGLGAGIWLIAVAGEWTADRQLAAFRGNASNKGRVCRVGLWRVSRHPNYFFEWVHWWTYVAIGVTGAWGGMTLLGPLLMLLFLFSLTGIPPTEANALRSRGEAYRRYKRTTSAFVPWFPAKESDA